MPVLPGAAQVRRGRPDRCPGRCRVRGAEPLPVQPWSSHGVSLPARRRLHRPLGRGDHRAGPVQPDGHDGDPVGQRSGRIQPRHEPGPRRGCGHRRAPAPARRAAVGRRHELHAGDRPDQDAAAVARPRPAGCSPTPGPERTPARAGRPGSRPRHRRQRRLRGRARPGRARVKGRTAACRRRRCTAKAAGEARPVGREPSLAHDLVRRPVGQPAAFGNETHTRSSTGR